MAAAEHLLVCRDGLCHCVCTTVFRLLFFAVKLVQVAELIALALVDEALAINLSELIIVPKYFYFLGD